MGLRGRAFGVWGDAGEGALGELLSDGLLSNLLEGYSEDKDGLVVASVEDYVSGSDAERLGLQGDEVLSDIFDDEVLDAARRSVGGGSLERVVYLAPSAYNDLVDLALPGSGEKFAGLLGIGDLRLSPYTLVVPGRAGGAGREGASRAPSLSDGRLPPGH